MFCAATAVLRIMGCHRQGEVQGETPVGSTAAPFTLGNSLGLGGTSRRGPPPVELPVPRVRSVIFGYFRLDAVPAQVRQGCGERIAQS
jgi:hypothetical protein